MVWPYIGSELSACGAGLKILSSSELYVSPRLCLEALSNEAVLVIPAEVLVVVATSQFCKLFCSVGSSLE